MLERVGNRCRAKKTALGTRESPRVVSCVAAKAMRESAWQSQSSSLTTPDHPPDKQGADFIRSLGPAPDHSDPKQDLNERERKLDIVLACAVIHVKSRPLTRLPNMANI